MPAEEHATDSTTDEETPPNRSVIWLSPQAAQAFNEALAQPACMSARLADALQHPRQFRWAD